MISLTPAEERLRDFLASLAAKADPARPAASTITYKDLALAVDPDNRVGWKGSHTRTPAGAFRAAGTSCSPAGSAA